MGFIIRYMATTLPGFALIALLFIGWVPDMDGMRLLLAGSLLYALGLGIWMLIEYEAWLEARERVQFWKDAHHVAAYKPPHLVKPEDRIEVPGDWTPPEPVGRQAG